MIAVTVRPPQVSYSRFNREKDIPMTGSRTYASWWDPSLIDERNERPLLSAFVAAIAIWATAALLTLV